MCFSCGAMWPWGHAVHLADAPTKDEYIFLDQNHSFYKDHRTPPPQSHQTSSPRPHHHLPVCKMPPSYYTYGDQYPSALNTQGPPPAFEWEDTSDWPKVYTYVAPNTGYQGYHPPAPVYQSSQPAMPQCYYNSQAPTQTPYYANGPYYAQPQAPAPGWPYSSSYYTAPNSYTCYPYIQSTQPQVTCSNYYTSLMNTAYPSYPYAPAQPTYATGAYNNWGTLLQASAAAAAANATLSQQPSAPAYFVGATRADVAFQNQLVAQNTGATMPSQLAPYKPAAGQQFWCKETDGSWTLRTHAEVTMGEVAPGHWEKHATSGYFYWIRQ